METIRFMLTRSTRLTACGLLLLLSIILGTGCGQDARKNNLTVTYIANEGFMIAMGNTKVLIDALPQSQYYLNPSDTIVTGLMKDVPPFDGVDYALVTHDHPDHFNADLMSRFLQSHQSVHFVAGKGPCGKLPPEPPGRQRITGIDLRLGQFQTIRNDKAEIATLPLVHVGNPDFPNLGFIVRANGRTIVHGGDARLEYNEEYLRKIDWKSYAVDLLFVEYFDNGSGTREIIEKLIRPGHVILMHVPGGEEARVADEAEKWYPRSIVFRREGETRTFDHSVGGTSSD